MDRREDKCRKAVSTEERSSFGQPNTQYIFPPTRGLKRATMSSYSLMREHSVVRSLISETIYISDVILYLY